MKEKYMVFIVQAYEAQTPDGSTLDNCTLELVCKTEKEALGRAKKIIKKKFYRLSRVIENFYGRT